MMFPMSTAEHRPHQLQQQLGGRPGVLRRLPHVPPLPRALPQPQPGQQGLDPGAPAGSQLSSQGFVPTQMSYSLLILYFYFFSSQQRENLNLAFKTGENVGITRSLVRPILLANNPVGIPLGKRHACLFFVTYRLLPISNQHIHGRWCVLCCAPPLPPPTSPSDGGRDAAGRGSGLAAGAELRGEHVPPL